MKIVRKTITVINETYDEYDLPNKPKELLGFINNMVLNIPIEYRDTVEIDFETITEYDVSSLRVNVTYRRIETLEELKNRQEHADRCVAADISRLKQLQEKYTNEI